jgi:hypothetical protein
MGGGGGRCTVKKDNKILLIYKEIHKGAVSKLKALVV